MIVHLHWKTLHCSIVWAQRTIVKASHRIKRESLKSSSNNKLRAEGYIPAILYGGKNPNLNISISKKEISTIINSDTFLSKVLEIDLDGKKEKVIPRDIAYHVVSEEPIHIDFMRIVSGKKNCFRNTCKIY